MKKNDILTSIYVEKLIYGGLGMATLPDGMKVLIKGSAIPESIVDLRVLKQKKNYVETQIMRVVKKSPFEEKLPEKWQIFGGCKWLGIPYEKQLEIKESQIKEAFHTLKSYTEKTIFHPITPSPEIIEYRNKIEFSWGKYISDRENIHDDFRFGFHVAGQYDRIENCQYCILGDEEVNALFRDIDIFSRNSGLPTYDPHTGVGFWRHLVIRKSKHKNAVMLIFSVNTNDASWSASEKEKMNDFIRSLAEKFPNIMSVYLLENTGRADIVTGKPVLLFGEKNISEVLLGKTFEIQPGSFFQTNSLGAERLYSLVANLCPNEGNILLDLYAGTGTIGILLAERFQEVYSVELVKSASEDGERNAKKNKISNISFINAKVEDFLTDFLAGEKKADVLIVDPPRDGLHPKASKTLLEFHPETLIYVSCNPASLTRDLTLLLESGEYTLTDIFPVDMFPHTHHIETIVRLERKTS